MGDNWDDDDDFLFDDDDLLEEEVETGDSPWMLLIVDDEPGIHDITKVALQRFSFDGRSLQFLSAYSAAEALEILSMRDDVAMILLDVVMETDHAGLDCARQIRDDLGNEAVRIILRTGQPGQAPEEDVILAFDINDYRAKTELTTQRLFTTVVSALRGYRDIMDLNKYREDAYAMMAENAASFQNLIDQTGTPLVQIGADLRIQRCNEAFANKVEQEMDKLIGLAVDKIPDLTIDLSTTPPSMTFKGETSSLKPTDRADGSLLCYTGALA